MEYKQNNPHGLVQLIFNPFTKETNFQLFKEQLHNQCLRMKEIGSAANTLVLPTIPARAVLAPQPTPDVESSWKRGEERRLNRLYSQEDRPLNCAKYAGSLAVLNACEIESWVILTLFLCQYSYYMFSSAMAGLENKYIGRRVTKHQPLVVPLFLALTVSCLRRQRKTTFPPN